MQTVKSYKGYLIESFFLDCISLQEGLAASNDFEKDGLRALAILACACVGHSCTPAAIGEGVYCHNDNFSRSRTAFSRSQGRDRSTDLLCFVTKLCMKVFDRDQEDVQL